MLGTCRRIVVSLAFLCLAAPAVSLAQPKSETPSAAGPAPTAHREGEYGGVHPGSEVSKSSKKRDARRRGCGKRNNRLTWVGFQVRPEGNSRLFAQLCGALDYEQTLVGNKLEITLVGARYATRNARRRLDTRYFETSVRQVTSRRVRRSRAKGNRPAQRAGIKLTVEFKNPADAAEANASIATEQDGYTYLFLEFGRGTEEPKSAEAGTSDVDLDEPPAAGGE